MADNQGASVLVRSATGSGWAVFGPLGLDDPYRYLLARDLREPLFRGAPPRILGAVLCNPSTATHEKPDPTIARMIGFARAWEFDVLELGNIFAFRSTNPKALYSRQDPVGPDNDEHLVAIARRASLLLCAWGNHGSHLGRGAQVEKLLRSVGAQPKALCLTRTNEPKHPLYIRGDAKPFALDERSRRGA